MLAPWKKTYDQTRQHIKKQRHYFAIKFHLVKAMVFPIVMYGCANWTIMKAEHWRIDAFELCEVLKTLRQWHPIPVLLPGKSHGWKSLVGCSPWGRKESDTTEQLHFHALKKGMAPHSSVLGWRIPEMGEHGRLPSMGSHRVRHDWSDLAAAAAVCFIPWSSCMPHTRVGLESENLIS